MKKWTGFWILLGVAIAAVLSILLGIHVMKQYEYSLLTSYAKQQDSFVQLVLDQINLQEDRSDEEIITEILGTLNSGDSSYWTFSKEQTILYVKNVTETYQYKGISISSYFTTETASLFLNQLKLNQVCHAIVNLDDSRYVASGVVFEYRGSEYRICLLTDDTVILNENNFLSAKIAMYGFWVAMLLVAVLSFLIAVIQIIKKDAQIEEGKKDILLLNQKMEQMDQKNKFHVYYSPSENAYRESMLEPLVESFKKRKVKSIRLYRVSFLDQELKENFLHRVGNRLGNHVIRFDFDREKAGFLFVNQPEKDCDRIIRNLLPEDVEITSVQDMMEDT